MNDRHAVATPPASFGVIAAAACLFYVAFIARTLVSIDGRRYAVLFDDAMISMRYARHFAEGTGLVWNAGEAPVQGFSNLLWTLAMALPHAAGVPGRFVALVVMAAGVAAMVAVTRLAWLLAREIAPDRPAAAPAAAGLTAASAGLVFWSLRGMEAGVLACCATASALLAIRIARRATPRDGAALAVVSAAAVLLRHDGILVVATVAAWLWINGRRGPAALALSSGLTGLAAQLLFSSAYYGHALPNTFLLKLTGSSPADRIERGTLALLLVTVRHLAPLLLFATLAVRGAGRRLADPIWMPAAVFVTCSAYSVFTGGDAWEWMPLANRFLAPGLPALCVLAGVGLAGARIAGRWLVALAALAVVQPGIWWACAFFDRGVAREFVAFFRSHTMSITAAAAVTTLLLAWTAFEQARRGRRPGVAALTAIVLLVSNGAAGATWVVDNAPLVQMDAFQTRLGVLIREATSADAVVAVTAAGTAPYFSERRAIDMRGKNDARVAGMPPVSAFVPGHDRWDLEYSIGALAPDIACGLPMAPGQREYLASRGYVETPNLCFVRRDSPRVGARIFEPLRRGR